MSNPALSTALNLLIGRLSDETWTECDELNECDEGEAALAILSTELQDNDVSITQEIYDRLCEAALAQGLGKRAFPLLESLIRD